MARTGFRGIDIRQTSAGKLIIRASIKDSSGAAVTAGSPTCRIVEIQDDGTFTTLEWNASGQYTFKANPLTPTSPTSGGAAAGVVTHQALGLWTCVIPNTSAFGKGSIYIAIISGGSGAFPVQQEREFQWGDAEGDFWVSAAKDAASFAVAGDEMNLAASPTGTLAAIKARTDFISSGTVKIVCPLTDNGAQITLVVGDDYYHAHGRALEFISDDYPDLTGATCQLRIMNKDSAALVFTVPGTVVDARTLRYEIPRVSTALLTPSNLGTYQFASRVVFADGQIATEKRGQVLVVNG